MTGSFYKLVGERGRVYSFELAAAVVQEQRLWLGEGFSWNSLYCFEQHSKYGRRAPGHYVSILHCPSKFLADSSSQQN